MEKNLLFIFPFLFFLVAIPTKDRPTTYPMATIQGIIYHCGYFTFDEHQARLEGTVIDVGVW